MQSTSLADYHREDRQAAFCRQRFKVTSTHEKLLVEFREFERTAATAESLMKFISQRLHETMTRYNWVGFYVADPADANFLLVGPYVGSFSPHVRIPLDRGLCGAAASTGQTIVANDVSKDPRYLAGSSLVNSEIVVPIFARRKLAGELDINSYFAGTFTPEERAFVEACAALVGNHIAKQ